MHWAAFAGAEISLSYIVAMNADVNAIDAKGLTPLHLAVKSAEDVRSTKSIKQLLIKGAIRNIKVKTNDYSINIGSHRKKASRFSF